MRTTKKIIKAAAIFLGITLVLAFVIWMFPGILINTATLRLALRMQNAVRLEPVPSHLRLRAGSISFMEKYVTLEARDGDGPFCVIVGGEAVRACANSLDVSIALRPDRRRWVRLTEIRNLDIDVPRATIATDDGPIHAKLKAWANGAVNLRAEAWSPAIGRVEATVEAQLHSGLSGDLNANVDYRAAGPQPVRAQAAASGRMDFTAMTYDLRIDGEAWGFGGFLRKVAVEDMHLRRERRVKADGRLTAYLQNALLDPRKDSILPPAKFDAGFASKVSIEERADRKSYDIALDLEPYSSYGIFLSGLARATYYPSKAMPFDVRRLRLKVDDPHFAATVKALRRTSMAVPAPFSALDGSITFEAGEATQEGKTLSIPLKLDTRLKSSKQALDTSLIGSFDIDFQTGLLQLGVDYRLTDVQMQLPDLNPILPQPQLVRDSRVISNRVSAVRKPERAATVEEKPEASSFKYSVRVRTAGKPVRALHSIFKPAAAFNVDLSLSHDKGVEGLVSAAPFGVKYQKRAAEVEKLAVRFSSAEEPVTLDGRLRIPKTDYQLFVDIIGSADRPRVVLASDPPLPEDDIISLLLFNQTTAELDSDQSSSVSDTQAAVANRAMGLFSIWALSSTPVESIQYNPSTEVYSARVRLADGFTATVGTEWERAQEVGLRKRIGRRWVVSTLFQTDQDGKRSQNVLLEWFLRY